MAFQAGQIVAERFKVISPIGSEPVTTIYKVLDTLTQKKLAIKLLATEHCTKDKVQALLSQVNTVHTFNHPNLAEVYEFFEQDGFVFYTLELCEGESIFSRLRNQIRQSDCIKWIDQILSAMQSFHEHDCLLGEVRLDKIIIDVDNNLHIMDFATDFPKQLNYDSTLIADLRAPETKGNYQYTKSSDVYSFGMFVELLCGCTELDKNDKTNFKRVLHYAYVAKQLMLSDPNKRPDLSKAADLLASSSKKRVSKTMGAAVAACFVTVCALLYFVVGTSPQAEQQGNQFSIVTSGDLSVLDDFSNILHYPLANNPALAPVNYKEVRDFSKRLLLSPSSNQADLLRIKEAFNLNYILLLNAEQTARSSFLLSAKYISMSSLDSLFDVEHRINVESMNEDLLRFSEKLFVEIASWSNYDLPLDYAPFVSASLRASGGAKINFDLIKNTLSEYPEVSFKLAQNLLVEGKKSDVLFLLDDALKVSEGQSYWWLRLRHLQSLAISDSESELSILKELGTRFPNRTEVLLYQSSAYKRMNNTNKALEVLRRANAIQPNNGHVLLDLATLRFEQGQFQETIDAELLKAQHSFRQRNDIEGESKAQVLLAEAYSHIGEQGTSLRVLSDMLSELSPQKHPQQFSEVLLKLARINQELENYEASEALYNRVVSFFDLNNQVLAQWSALTELARMYHTNGRYEKAQLSLEKALKLVVIKEYRNQKQETLLSLGDAFYAQGKLKQAQSIVFEQENFNDIEDDKRIKLFDLKLRLDMLSGDLVRLSSNANLLNSIVNRPVKHYDAYLTLSRAYFTLGKLIQSTEALNAVLSRTAELKGSETARVLQWKSHRCMLIADFSCAQEARELAVQYLDETMTREKLIDHWLVMSINKSLGSRKGLSPALLLDLIIKTPMPVSEHLAMMIDVQVRFNLAFNSDYVKRIDTFIQDNYQLLSLEYVLSQADDTGNYSHVAAVYNDYLSYWRHHFFARKIAMANNNIDSYKDSETQWFNNLSDLQISRYKKFYY